MSYRSKSLQKSQDSLLISGINTSTLHKRLENYQNPPSNLLSSRLDLSSSRVSDDPIKVQDSFSISEIYKEVEKNKENLLEELYENSSIMHTENSEFLKLLEDNTAISKHKTYSKLDESSIVGENCKIIVQKQENHQNDLARIKYQQKKYYKAFMIMQALFISTKESTDRKINSLNSQIGEVNSMIKENKEFKNQLEAAVNLKLDVLKEEIMQKFVMDSQKIIEKYRNRECDYKAQTKNKIIKIRKEVDNDLDGSKAKNSEELLRKNCEMRLKIALMGNDDTNTEE